MTDWLLENRASVSADDVDWSALLERHGVEIEGRFDSIEALEDAEIQAGDRLLVAGGDGTVNRVAAMAIDRRWTLGVLPAGTGNDFARSLGMELSSEDACRQIAHAETRDIDIATINDCVLLNAAQIGMGPDIDEEADRRFKRFWGRLGYLRSLVARLYRSGGMRARIAGPDEHGGGRWMNITIANGPFFGGGHRIDPDARIDDGLLDIVALRARPWYQLIWAGVLRRIGIGYPDSVKHWRLSCVEVRTRHPHDVSVDGDVRTRTPATARVRPGALRVSVPAEPARSSLLS